MDYALRDAKARLSELVTAAERGERVVITRHGKPAVELRPLTGGAVRSTSTSWKRRVAASGSGKRRREELAEWQARFEDPAFSRQVLGLDEDEEPS